jgi:hypothetical protein
MLDEIIVTEIPPLYCCYGRVGQQVCVPITGNRTKRIIHGVLNITTGDLLLLITEVWDQLTHQCFLKMIRAHWRAWQIVLFEDRGSPHTAEDSFTLAAVLNIEIRLLPRACPELMTGCAYLVGTIKSWGWLHGEGEAQRQGITA